jgi:hypothetical protein
LTDLKKERQRGVMNRNNAIKRMSDINMVTKNNLTTTIAPIEQEMVVARVFDAPRRLVFKAYIDPNLIPQ